MILLYNVEFSPYSNRCAELLKEVLQTAVEIGTCDLNLIFLM